MLALRQLTIHSILLGLTLFLCACQSAISPNASLRAQSSQSLDDLQDAFWESLTRNCGKTFIGVSSFPDDPEDSFFGKSLKAKIDTCSDKEIHVPFHVGTNTSRTWIFTRGKDGLQLKHQHLHNDGSPDEVSNYGGMASTGNSALVQASSNTEVSQVSLSFPADDFTKQLIPDAATNVWTLTILSSPSNEFAGITYYLTRHNQPRFKASLARVD